MFTKMTRNFGCYVVVAASMAGQSQGNVAVAGNFSDGVAMSVSTGNNGQKAITNAGEAEDKVEKDFFDSLWEICLFGNFSPFSNYVSKNFPYIYKKIPYAKAVAARLIIYILSVLVAGTVNGCRYVYRNKRGWKWHAFKNAFSEILENPFLYVPAVACFF